MALCLKTPTHTPFDNAERHRWLTPEGHQHPFSVSRRDYQGLSWEDLTGGLLVAMLSLGYLGTGTHFEGRPRRWRVGYLVEISSADIVLWLQRRIGLFMAVPLPQGALRSLAI